MLGLLVAGCSDSTGPGCGRCLPVTAIAVEGVLVSSTRIPPANVRLRLFPEGGTTAGRCSFEAVRDTTIATPAAIFRGLLIAGFPHFGGCVEIDVSPVTAGAFPATIVVYPHLVLRDTSIHDTLRVAIRIDR